MSENQANWSGLLKGECVETVIVASTNYMEDAVIQHHALEFFSRIALDANCRESIRTHDGVRSILEVMTNNAAVKHVQQYGGITLNLLAMEESGANLLSRGKMDILFDDYKAYKADDEVMVPIVGIFALYSQDIHRDSIAQMLDEAFLHPLVEFLETRRDNVKLESEVYEVISNLCADEKANPYFMDHGVPALYNSTLREENGKTLSEEEKKLSSELVINLCHAVRCLLKGREVNSVVDATLLRTTLELFRKDSDALLALLAVYEVVAKDGDYVNTMATNFALYKESIHFWMIDTDLPPHEHRHGGGGAHCEHGRDRGRFAVHPGLRAPREAGEAGDEVLPGAADASECVRALREQRHHHVRGAAAADPRGGREGAGRDHLQARRVSDCEGGGERSSDESVRLCRFSLLLPSGTSLVHFSSPHRR